MTTVRVGGVSRRLPRAKEAEIIATTQRAPTHATQWSCRKPHLIKTFKVSNDPDFIEKLEDVMWRGSI
jgi:hypothetical protein